MTPLLVNSSEAYRSKILGRPCNLALFGRGLGLGFRSPIDYCHIRHSEVFAVPVGEQPVLSAAFVMAVF